MQNKSRTPFPLMLIGAGGFGAYHLTSINTLCREGRIHLVAVADPAINMMPQLKAELESRNVRLYSDWKKMIDQEQNCRAVTIAAPIPFHYEIAKLCIERDLLIYLEKPAVPLLPQLEDLVRLDKSQHVYIGFQHLYYPWMQKLKAWITEGRFGALTSIRSAACWNRTDTYYRRSGWSGKMMFQNRPVFDGPATNALAHLVHNIMYLASPYPNKFAVPSEIRGEIYRARRIESYDTASMRGEFHDGPSFSLSVTHAAQAEQPFQISILGSKGWAKVSLNGRSLETSFTEPEEYKDATEVLGDSYCAFSDFVEGKLDRPKTALADCRGYTIATNGMLISSGEIYNIPDEFISLQGSDGNKCYEVNGLSDAVMATIENGGTLSDMNLPWAVQTDSISCERIETTDLSPYLSCHALSQNVPV